MDGIETLGILEEIQALVFDKLQVVSYKWLSRNFLVSSNTAKRLLEEFVEKYGNGFDVIYTLSGMLRSDPSIYHIRLVSGPKLSDAKQEFDDSCSVQVYSVQACIPKDPAALWNAEFVQAEELFKQGSTVNNCLLDNRFCGILNPFVKRNSAGISECVVTPQLKNARVTGPSKNNSVDVSVTIPQPQHREVQQSIAKTGLQTSSAVIDVKSESYGGHKLVNKLSSDKERVPQLPANKKKGQNERSSSGTGGSLANMWGRACVKSKPSASAENNNPIPQVTVSAEAQIIASEVAEGISSDDDCRDVKFKRASNGEGRKRKVVFNFSDDEEEYKDAVSLASPDYPKRQSFLDPKGSTQPSIPAKNNLNLDMQKEEPKLKEEKVTNLERDKPLREVLSTVGKSKNAGISSSDKIQSHIHENDITLKDKVTDAPPNSPKRRKVLKTRIDERGREVTEVVWEGEEILKEADSNMMTKADANVASNSVNRAPPAKKSSAMGSTAPSNVGGKAVNKKAGSMKDPKQGNILSFFKRV